jgi:hypothetical protein
MTKNSMSKKTGKLKTNARIDSQICAYQSYCKAIIYVIIIIYNLKRSDADNLTIHLHNIMREFYVILTFCLLYYFLHFH